MEMSRRIAAAASDHGGAPAMLGLVMLAIAFAAGVFVGVLGPYGSYLNGAPGLRIFHFVVCFCVGSLIFGVLQRLAVAGADRWKLPVWPAIG
jgi:hypothetical protein